MTNNPNDMMKEVAELLANLTGDTLEVDDVKMVEILATVSAQATEQGKSFDKTFERGVVVLKKAQGYAGLAKQSHSLEEFILEIAIHETLGEAL